MRLFAISSPRLCRPAFGARGPSHTGYAAGPNSDRGIRHGSDRRPQKALRRPLGGAPPPARRCPPDGRPQVSRSTRSGVRTGAIAGIFAYTRAQPISRRDSRQSSTPGHGRRGTPLHTRRSHERQSVRAPRPADPGAGRHHPRRHAAAARGRAAGLVAHALQQGGRAAGAPSSASRGSSWSSAPGSAGSWARRARDRARSAVRWAWRSSRSRSCPPWALPRTRSGWARRA